MNQTSNPIPAPVYSVVGEVCVLNHQNSQERGRSSRLWDRRGEDSIKAGVVWNSTRGSGLGARTQRKEVDMCQLGGAKKLVHDKVYWGEDLASGSVGQEASFYQAGTQNSERAVGNKMGNNQIKKDRPRRAGGREEVAAVAAPGWLAVAD